METGSVLHVKISLLGTRPPVWRRVVVPAAFTLEQFHRVLQITMGWGDEHLHEFRAGDKSYGPTKPDEPDQREPALHSERRVRLATLLPRVGARALYIYDFGDNWRHQLIVEKRVPAAPGQVYPLCTSGRRACPPEDCGGAFGYARLIQALYDPQHPEHEEFREWAGDDFDPAAFSAADVTLRLAADHRRQI